MSVLTKEGSPILLFDSETIADGLRLLPDGATRYVPDDPAELDSFIRLSLNSHADSCRSFPFTAVYRSSGFPLMVRVQGAVTDYALAICGDSGRHLDGDGDYHWGPLTFLRLAPGYTQFYGPFRMQMEALGTLIDNIFAQAGLEAPRTQQTLPRDLILRRRVYGGSGLMAGRHTVQTVSAGGTLCTARRGDLQAGDLVEVTAYVDFEVLRDADGLPRTSIFLAFNRVVRLRRAIDLQMKYNLGAFRLPMIVDRFDYKDTGNIGFTPFVAVDNGGEHDAPSRALRALAEHGNVSARVEGEGAGDGADDSTSDDDCEVDEDSDDEGELSSETIGDEDSNTEDEDMTEA